MRRYRAANPASEATKKRARERVKTWANLNPERAKATAFAGQMRRLYGLSLTRYLCALQQQNHKCLRCRSERWGTKHNTPHIDHDHDTKAFRGLLCLWCNQMLGHLGDNLKNLHREYESYKGYLEGRL